MLDEKVLINMIDLKRHINSIEHMIYVSCKFTRTTEMLKRVMNSLIVGYEMFFNLAYSKINLEENDQGFMIDKIKNLKEYFIAHGNNIDVSEYYLLKRLIASDFECIGEYRKNLSLITYINDEEYVINIARLLTFYNNLKELYENIKIINLS